MKLLLVYQYCQAKFLERVDNEKGQFALDIALGMAVVLVISAFIIMPGLRSISTDFMTSMTTWWENTMSSQIFKTSGN